MIGRRLYGPVDANVGSEVRIGVGRGAGGVFGEVGGGIIDDLVDGSLGGGVGVSVSNINAGTVSDFNTFRVTIAACVLLWLLVQALFPVWVMFPPYDPSVFFLSLKSLGLLVTFEYLASFVTSHLPTTPLTLSALSPY